MNKLRTSSARALLRRRFHASRHFRAEISRARIRRFVSRAVRLLCQPVSAARSIVRDSTAPREGPSRTRNKRSPERAYRVYARQI